MQNPHWVAVGLISLGSSGGGGAGSWRNVLKMSPTEDGRKPHCPEELRPAA